MFIGLLRVVPGGRPVRPHTRLEALKTLHPWARHLGQRSTDRTRLTYRPSESPCVRRHATTTRLGPPGGEFAPHLRRPHPATAPRPASGDADQTPLDRGGIKDYKHRYIGLSRRIDSPG